MFNFRREMLYKRFSKLLMFYLKMFLRGFSKITQKPFEMTNRMAFINFHRSNRSQVIAWWWGFICINLQSNLVWSNDVKRNGFTKKTLECFLSLSETFKVKVIWMENDLVITQNDYIIKKKSINFPQRWKLALFMY